MGVEGSVTSTNLVLVDPGAFEATLFVSFGKKWSVLVELVSILSFLDFVVGFVVPVPIVVDLSMTDVEEFAVTCFGITFSLLDSVGEAIVEVGEYVVPLFVAAVIGLDPITSFTLGFDITVVDVVNLVVLIVVLFRGVDCIVSALVMIIEES